MLLVSKIDRSRFLHEVKARWPELREPINAEQGLLHLAMAVVRRFAQGLIDGGRERGLAECYAFIDSCYRDGNAGLRNAIDVSFVEDLSFAEGKRSRRRGFDLLPATLRQLYVDFHGEP